MKPKEIYELIGKLRVLSESSGATEAEAENARQRMDELETKLKYVQATLTKNRRITSESARAKDRVARKKPKSRKNVLVSLTKRSRPKPVPIFRQEWPIGWECKSSVSVDTMDSTNGTLILNWKCPSCGCDVERVVFRKHRMRLKGKPNGELEFVNRIRRGETNQLCDKCWEKFR